MNAGNFAAKTKQALTNIDESKLKARPGSNGSGQNFDPIVKFYQFTVLGDKAGPKSAYFGEGDKLVGKYKGSYTKTREITLKNGKKKNITETKYLIETDEGTVAIGGATILNDLNNVVKGANVAVTHNGSGTSKAGNDFHKVSIVASEWVNQDQAANG